MTGARALGKPDAVILPGTKSTLSDLLWLRESGLEAAILKLAAAGTPVLGICGGYQMLGRTIADPDGAEGEAGAVMRGLGLLPADTVFYPEKTRTRVTGTALAGPFAGARLEGYEIHMGRTEVRGGEPFCREATARLADALCRRKGIDPVKAAPLSHAAFQEQEFDRLAAAVRGALDMDAIYRMMEV